MIQLASLQEMLDQPILKNAYGNLCKTGQRTQNNIDVEKGHMKQKVIVFSQIDQDVQKNSNKIIM